ncbi:MAG TPA: hypothetical protein VLF18_08570 [Tahibacter sp.]|uniref:hypothetical protein n=1 Tax=Tahibacter sp. TaxID=2056211 RepID=UPI002B65567A|nr:hypothetical protein [Tahibacter sp.]HSX60237.1 hypothetical protein [Tahibacter sp.]
MTSDHNPQLSAAARVVMDASMLAQDASVPITHRFMTLALIIEELVLVQHSLIQPGIVAPPDAKKTAMLVAIVTNVIERLGRLARDDEASGARVLLHEMAVRIEYALSPNGPLQEPRSH